MPRPGIGPLGSSLVAAWVQGELVGDAGHHKHAITAMGMTDAFVDAERIAGALDDWLSGHRSFDDAMGDYHRTRANRRWPCTT